MEGIVTSQEVGLNLKATELRLGLPGSDEVMTETTSTFRNNKRSVEESNCDSDAKHDDCDSAPAAK